MFMLAVTVFIEAHTHSQIPRISKNVILSLSAASARSRDRRERGAGELHQHREGVRGGQADRVRRAAREDRQVARGLGLRARAR